MRKEDLENKYMQKLSEKTGISLGLLGFIIALFGVAIAYATFAYNGAEKANMKSDASLQISQDNAASIKELNSKVDLLLGYFKLTPKEK